MESNQVLRGGFGMCNFKLSGAFDHWFERSVNLSLLALDEPSKSLFNSAIDEVIELVVEDR